MSNYFHVSYHEELMANKLKKLMDMS